MDSTGTQSAWLQTPEGQRTPVSGSCFLGRSAGCEVVLANAKVSRQHALIHGQEGSEFWLIDLGSSNGTYLNGRRVSQPCRLTDGDVIMITGLTLTFNRPAAPIRLTSDSSITQATIHEVRQLMCWLLIADIEGSTRLLQAVPPQEAPRVTGPWLSTCAKVIDQHQGSIDKFLGDGFLAYWPADNSDAASVAGALAGLRTMQEAANPPFRIVLHRAQIAIGSAPGGESLLGNEINFAFRLEKLAAQLKVPRLMSAAAQAAIKPSLSSTPAGQFPLPGFTGEFAVFTF